MNKKFTTKEDIDSLTREELEGLQEMCDAVIKAFKSGDKSDRWFAPIRSLCPFLLVVAWSRLTAGGAKEYELCRHAHEHLADDVLQIFGA